MEIRDYIHSDEKEWVYTKALSYLFSPFFDEISIISGDVGTGNGDEFRNTDRGTYTPMFISVSNLPAVNVIPKQVVKDLLPFA